MRFPFKELSASLLNLVKVDERMNHIEIVNHAFPLEVNFPGCHQCHLNGWKFNYIIYNPPQFLDKKKLNK